MLAKILVASAILFSLVACKDEGTPIEQQTSFINYCSEDTHCVTTAQEYKCDPLTYNKNENPKKVLDLQNEEASSTGASVPRCRPSLYKIKCEENKCVAHFETEVEVVAGD